MQYGFSNWFVVLIMVIGGTGIVCGTARERVLKASLDACQETQHGLHDAAEIARTQVKTSADTIAQREQDVAALQEELKALRTQAADWEHRAKDAEDTGRPLPKFGRW